MLGLGCVFVVVCFEIIGLIDVVFIFWVLVRWGFWELVFKVFLGLIMFFFVIVGDFFLFFIIFDFMLIKCFVFVGLFLVVFLVCCCDVLVWCICNLGFLGVWLLFDLVEFFGFIFIDFFIDDFDELFVLFCFEVEGI